MWRAQNKRFAGGEKTIFASYLETFTDHETLRKRVAHVLHSLPLNVRNDFLDDESFHVALDDYVHGQGRTIWMAGPGSRSVILKPRLNDCSEEFAMYVIAHEFAHAFLHNGGWGNIADPELAADELAASWGFPRPAKFS